MLFKKKKPLMTIDLLSELRGVEGIFAAPISTISLETSYTKTVLCLQDNKVNIHNLAKIENIHLQVKVSGIETPYGMLIILLFRFWNVENEDDKFSY
jgi:hypothetical protein